MSEDSVEDLIKQSLALHSYPQCVRDDCLKLNIAGMGSRNIRRILARKYARVPNSSTIRGWMRKDNPGVNNALAKVNTEADVLSLLKDEAEYVEDISDDILSFAVPSLMKKLKKGGFDDMPLKEHTDVVTKEINSKSQRNDRKILRQPGSHANIPQFIILASRQSPEPPTAEEFNVGPPTTEELNGSSDSGNTTIIDADFKQVADIPTTGLQPPPGDTD